MAIFLYADNARATIGSPVAISASSITLGTGGGAAFPSPGPGQQFALTINDLATQAIFEVCWCTARSGDVLTVLRGQEGTTPRAWGVGDYVWNGPTSGQMNNLVQIPHMTDASIAPIFATTQVQGTFSTTGPATFGSTGNFSGSVTARDPNAAGSGGVNVQSTGATTGASIALRGTGSAPNKYIRSINGVLDVMNSAYTQEIMSLSDVGDLAGIRNITAAGAGAFSGPVSSNSSGTFTDPGTAGVAVNAGPNGANIVLRGTGSAPNKYIRSLANRLEIVSSGYTGVLASVDETGTINAAGSLGAALAVNAGTSISAGGAVSGATVNSTNGNVTAVNGRLRATFGARGSGDASAAVLLGDFPASFGSTGYQYLPNGFIIQWGFQVLNGDPTVPEFFPIAFPTECLTVVCTEGAAHGSWFVDPVSTPTIHGVSGFVFNAWYHGGVLWSESLGKIWIAANLTTAWIALGH